MLLSFIMAAAIERAMIRRHRKTPPMLWLMTDERIADALLLASVARLPRGQAGIVFRHYHTEKGQRRALFAQVAAIARRRRLRLLLAGSPRQAAAWRADGWHGRDHEPSSRPLLHSIPAHNLKEVVAASRGRASLLFLSPLFPTRSHPGGRALGRVRFALLARQTTLPVIALGGVRSHHRRLLKEIGASGWAAIDGVTARSPP
jgi:thiamine-phosphate pyrophosphorylase